VAIDGHWLGLANHLEPQVEFSLELLEDVNGEASESLVSRLCIVVHDKRGDDLCVDQHQRIYTLPASPTLSLLLTDTVPVSFPLPLPIPISFPPPLLLPLPLALLF
jgi:hypothetical protein